MPFGRSPVIHFMFSNHLSYSGNITPSLLVLPSSQGILVIPVSHIVRIQSISNYSKLFLADGKNIVVAKVLHWFEAHPSLACFVRIHRTHLVNVQHIKQYSHSKNGSLSMQNEEILPVARRRKGLLIQQLRRLNYPTATGLSYISKFVTNNNMVA